MAIPFSGGGGKKLILSKRTEQIESKITDVIANDFFLLLFLNISCRINLF
jgi:hypothetical protein